MRTPAIDASVRVLEAYDTIHLLRKAHQVARRAGLPRVTPKIEAAIRSADGAVRHAERRARAAAQTSLLQPTLF